MDKEDFCIILQCALFNFDGVEFDELKKEFNYNDILIKKGIKLAEALK